MTRMTIAVVAMAIMAVVSGCGGQPEPARLGANVFVVGDCVKIPVGTPAEPGISHAASVPCTADPSYTVGAMADAAGACPSTEYQQLPTKFADPSTAKLCLVPNLVADHCYELAVPIGLVQLADCSARGQAGLLVQVVARLDVRDQHACPSTGGQYAWPYPSPARTYCTVTII